MKTETVSRDIEASAQVRTAQSQVQSLTFVLFGATGDLAKRKIFPALYNLFLDGKLPASFCTVCAGREKWSDQEMQDYISSALKTFSRKPAEDRHRVKEFLLFFHYQQLDSTQTENYHTLREHIEKKEAKLGLSENRIFYLAVAPELIGDISLNLKRSGLNRGTGWKRLIVEKPFGHNLASAQKLNKVLRETFEEKEIYRIDHYLGKPMVQSLESLVCRNPIIKSVLNNQFISNVQIKASETVGVGQRAGYYDPAGALRDMVQNHLLQLLMMTAMHVTNKSSTASAADRKKSILQSLRPLQKEDVAANVVRGQYTAGEIMGEAVPAYQEEPGVRPFSDNNTFVAARLWIDDEEWAGVPFYICTGKRMKKKATRIVIEFKSEQDGPDFNSEEERRPNLLTIEISPKEGVSLQLNIKNPVTKQVEPVSIDFSASSEHVPEAYELLLFDAILGKNDFFAHWNEVELSWEWVQPILEAFEEGKVPLHLYRAGSTGPKEAEELLHKNGFHWWDPAHI